MNLDPCLRPYAKINFRQIVVPRVKVKTVKFPEINIWKYHDLGVGRIFKIGHRNTNFKKIGKLDSTKIKNFFHQKEASKKAKRQVLDWEKIFSIFPIYTTKDSYSTYVKNSYRSI